MSTNISLEQRVAAVEAAITEIKKQLADSQSTWLQQVTGSFKDEPAFDEILAYGRAIRRSESLLAETQVEQLPEII